MLNRHEWGWIYIIKNRDLYKIGITKNIDIRMRQLKPDCVISKLFSSDFKQLEKELHRKYKKARIPQTEYFRLNQSEIREIKKRIRTISYPFTITLDVLKNTIYLSLLLFLLLFVFISFNINDLNNVFFYSLLWMERIAFYLSFISLLIKSDRYFSFFNELKFRLSRFCILALFAFFFKFASSVYMHS